MSNETYETANRYAALGLSVIPIIQKPGDIKASKRPLVKWKQYQDELPGPEQLESWFNNGSHQNLALMGGRVSGNVLWLDFDDMGAYHDWADEYPDLASTAPTQTTGKGCHVGVKTSDPPPGNQDLYYHGAHVGETRGEGGYIIAAPSLHGSGRLYEWVRPPWAADWPVIDDLADIGLTTRDKAKKSSNVGRRAAGIANGNGRVRDRHPRVEATIGTMLGRLATSVEPGRNNALNVAAYTLGGFIQSGELSRSEIEQMLTPIALSIGLGEQETMNSIRSGLNGGEAAPVDVTDDVTPSPPTNPTIGDDAPDLPRIQTNARHHRNISNDAYHALLTANEPPYIFVRSGRLARITLDEDSRPTTEEITPEGLKYHLDRVANFYTVRQKQDGETTETDSSVPMAVVKDVLAYPQWGELPPLGNIVTFPTFSTDGTLHDQAGYNPKTRLYYYKNGLKLGEYEPVGDNIAHAKGLIDELLEGFPFVDNASKTNAIALLLLPFVRAIIKGNTPLHMIDAPSHGTGKTLLAQALATLAAPNGFKTMTAPTTDEEWEKKIVTALMGAPSHIMIDNIPDTLQSATLAAVLTAEHYTSRVLGLLKEITVQVKNVWIGTGNNTTAHGELARRTVWIRIDSKLETPWKRTGFRHPDLIGWIQDKRGELITAALTLIKLWYLAGCPESELTLGSYERWVKIIGGILETAGYKDFMGNADEMYNRSAVDRLPWVAFVERWYESYGHRPVGVKELFSLASEYDPSPDIQIKGENILGEQIAGRTERSRKIKLGKLLKDGCFKVFGEHRIIEAGTKHRLALYRIEPANRLF